MTGSAPHVVELSEYETRYFDDLSSGQGTSHELATEIWRRYSSQVSVEFPSPRTNGHWALKSGGWIGHIPVSKSLVLRLLPKVEVRSVLEMLDYAYRIREIAFPEGLAQAATLSDALDLLAGVFARRVLARTKKGLHREYIERIEDSRFLRGRLLVERMSHRPWDVRLPCQFSEQSADIDDNQIVMWTLFLMTRAGLPNESKDLVGRAFRSLRGAVRLVEHTGQSCLGRVYNRLNSDYQVLHALARFFLDHITPSHNAGDDATIPFLIEMPHLFEAVVAEWLEQNASDVYDVERQELIYNAGLEFKIDLVVRELRSQKAICVLDTKYKAGPVSNDDVYQAVTYAKLVGCCEAFLVYPAELVRPLDIRVGDVHVRSVTFDINKKVETSGVSFIAMLSAMTGVGLGAYR